MLWIILIAFLVLVAFAYDWISFQVTGERVIVSLELARIAPVVRHVKQTAADVFSRVRQLKQR